MFVHIVFWRLHDTAPNGRTKEENARELKRRFEALNGLIPGLTRCELGADVSRTTESADVALLTEFDSKAALEGYQSHPAHQDIVAFLKDVRSERRVVDYEM
jgi:heme-degrading monooxygenase HmoA